MLGRAEKLDRLDGILKVPASDARTNFGAIIRRARLGECVIVEKDGMPEVAVISVARLAAGFSHDYDKIKAAVARTQPDDLKKPLKKM